MPGPSTPRDRMGWAVVENGVVIEACDADRIVPWWSFTKTVIAAAALALVRNGAVALDSFLPGRAYTLRQLLQHRSGLPDYGGVGAYHLAVAQGEVPWTFEELWERCDADRLMQEPGSGWAYSNIGYALVARLIEDETQSDLDAALRRLVLDPLEVGGARIASVPEDLRGVEMGTAAGYHPGWVYHGLLVGSVADAALLLDRLLSGNLLPIELRNDMESPYVLPGPVAGRPWTKPGYGLGVMMGEATIGPVVGHTGGGPGSAIAVYRALSCRALTAAVFNIGENAGAAEAKACALIAN